MLVKETNNIDTHYSIYRDLLSEIDFYQNELGFLDILLSHYYISMNRSDFYMKSNQLNKMIKTLNAALIHIKSEIYTQTKLISISTTNSRGEAALKNNYNKLTTEFAQIKIDINDTKTSVYDILKEVLKTKKQKRLN